MFWTQSNIKSKLHGLPFSILCTMYMCQSTFSILCTMYNVSKYNERLCHCELERNPVQWPSVPPERVFEVWNFWWIRNPRIREFSKVRYPHERWFTFQKASFPEERNKRWANECTADNIQDQILYHKNVYGSSCKSSWPKVFKIVKLIDIFQDYKYNVKWTQVFKRSLWHIEHQCTLCK